MWNGAVLFCWELETEADKSEEFMLGGGNVGRKHE